MFTLCVDNCTGANAIFTLGPICTLFMLNQYEREHAFIAFSFGIVWSKISM